MARTLSELYDYCRDYLDVDDDDMSDQLILHWIRDGYGKIIRQREEWQGFETTATLPTVADTQTYDLPIDDEITQIFGPSGPLAKYGQGEAERYFGAGYSTDTSEPLAWSVYGEQLYFWPKPDAVYNYSVRGITKPSAPSQPDDIPELPNEEAHELLLDYVMAEACVQQEDDRSGWFRDSFVEGLKQLSISDATAPSYGPLIINGHPVGTEVLPEMGRFPGNNFPA